MESYQIEIKRSAAKEIEQLPSKDRERVIKAIQGLAKDPRPAGCKKLTADEKYRLSQGNYRILYQILDQRLTVVVVRVRHRKDVYKK